MAIYRGTGDATGNAAISEIENLRSDAQLAANAAEEAQGYAEEWANKAEDSLVSTAAGGDGVDDYSALHWSIKSSDSATLALDALDEFTDLYLGAKATEPTLDNDGDALQDGALYFNTTSSTMFVYDLSTTTWLGVSGEGFLVAANNLSDLVNTTTARSNLGVEIGVDVQAYDVDTAKYDDVTANFTGTLQNGGSNVVVDSDIGVSVQAYNATLTDAATQNSVGRKNLIINGNKVINQRRASSNTATSNAYNFDRWYYDGTYLYQSVEEANLIDGTYAVSWDSDATCEYQLITTGTASSGLSAITTGWTSVTNQGSFALASVSGNHLWLRFTAGVDGLNALTNLQLERGSVATSFEYRPAGVEEQMCQRYFEMSYNRDYSSRVTTVGAIGQRAANVTLECHVGFKVAKRVTPTVTVYNPDSGAANSIRNVTAETNITSSVIYQGQSGFVENATTTDANRYRFHYEANAEL